MIALLRGVVNQTSHGVMHDRSLNEKAYNKAVRMYKRDRKSNDINIALGERHLL